MFWSIAKIIKSQTNLTKDLPSINWFLRTHCTSHGVTHRRFQTTDCGSFFHVSSSSSPSLFSFSLGKYRTLASEHPWLSGAAPNFLRPDLRWEDSSNCLVSHCQLGVGRPKIITFPTFSSLTVVCWRGFIPLRLLSNKVDIADYKDDHGGDCKDFISNRFISVWELSKGSSLWWGSELHRWSYLDLCVDHVYFKIFHHVYFTIQATEKFCATMY